MKSVMISIKPKWCELIASGKKTVEVRKTRPKIETPFKCYIYCTLPPKEELLNFGGFREYANELIRLQDGLIVYDYGMRVCCDIENRPYSQDNFLCKKVIGEFVCENILSFDLIAPSKEFLERQACLSYEEMLNYAQGKPLYGWHISDLVIYDKPKELSEFYKPCTDPYQYCQGCKHGLVQYSADVETSEDLAGCCFDTVCLNKMTRPPQSWCYCRQALDWSDTE